MHEQSTTDNAWRDDNDKAITELWTKKLEITIIYRGYIGIMEKKMETTISASNSSTKQTDTPSTKALARLADVQKTLHLLLHTDCRNVLQEA